MSKPLKIGITGGIGTGKSYVAHLFNQLGAAVYNADDRAKWVMNNQPDLRQGITQLFGPNAYLNNQLNRNHISALVFNNSPLLNQLNELVHPAVGKDFEIWHTQQKTNYVIKEAALLFESKSFLTLDAVIVVDAPLELRIHRCIQRDALSKEEITRRINNQLPQSLKIELADYVIVNDGRLPITPQVYAIHSWLSE